VVFVRLVGIAVHAETVVTRIIIVIRTWTRPTVIALNTKVVVTGAGELASTSAALQQTLRQSNRCRYAITLHLLDGNVLILIYILLIGLIPSDLRKRRNRQEKSYEDYKFSHIMHFICAKVMISLELFVFLQKNIGFL
jgi:hypothetical protein